jgi:opacity protein-like surface antigen
MKLRIMVTAGLCGLLGPVGEAAAADAIYPGAETVEYKTPSGWTFTVAPYAWLAGLEGDVGVGGRTTHIDASFGDILSNFDIAVMGVAEARYERFGVFTDLNYVRLSTSADTPFGILASSADFTTHSLMWTAAAEYRLVDAPDGSIDAFAGFRLYSIKNELDFNGPGLLGGLSLSDQQTWADPIFGLKANYNVTSQLYLTGWGMLGGGVSAKITWDVMAGAGYQFTDSFSAVLGYRATGVNYENGGFTYDTVQQGPIIGAVFRF